MSGAGALSLSLTSRECATQAVFPSRFCFSSPVKGAHFKWKLSADIHQYIG